MKYSSTLRLMNVVLFALLGTGTGILGIYFGFVIAPHLWFGDFAIGFKAPDMSLALVSLLGALGLAGFGISLLGFVKSIMSLVKKDDEIVRQAFGCYIALGYIVAVFFLLNAVWLYRLLTSNIGFDDLGFAIVIYVILMLVALIASSIPLVKMFGEGEGTNRVMMTLSEAAIAVNLAIAVEFCVIFCANVGKINNYAHADVMATKFGLYALVPFLAAVVACIALLGYKRAEKAGAYRKLNGVLFECSLAIDALAIVMAGIFAYVYKDNPYSLMAKGVMMNWSYNEEFAIASWIVGGIMFLLSCLLVYLTVCPPKAKAVER